MKKIGKLEINSDRVIKNEELIKLRGGEFNIHCWTEGWTSGCMGNELGSVPYHASCTYGMEAIIICQANYPGSYCAEYETQYNC
jgi:hypothetical protein